MGRYDVSLRAVLEEGQSLEVGLARLRAQGATPVETIKAICQVQQISLVEAKQLFAASPAWALEAAAGSALHEKIISLLSKEPHD